MLQPEILEKVKAVLERDNEIEKLNIEILAEVRKLAVELAELRGTKEIAELNRLEIVRLKKQLRCEPDADASGDEPAKELWG